MLVLDPRHAALRGQTMLSGQWRWGSALDADRSPESAAPGRIDSIREGLHAAMHDISALLEMAMQPPGESLS